MSTPKKEALEAAVLDYEQSAGMDAVNYRALRKNASIRAKLEAARRDANWWNDHSYEVTRTLDRTIGNLKLELGI